MHWWIWEFTVLAQAASFMNDARALSATGTSVNDMAQVLANLHPMGAQFSSCWAGYTIGVGGLGIILGGAFAHSADVAIAGSLVLILGVVVELRC